MKGSRPETLVSLFRRFVAAGNIHMSNIVVRCVDLSDASCFEDIADDLFDDPIDQDRLNEFLADARHQLVIAQDGETIVGFASAVDYVHPDKVRELWINEVSVASSHHRQASRSWQGAWLCGGVGVDGYLQQGGKSSLSFLRR